MDTAKPVWEWARLSQPEFDRAVELLVEMEFGESHIVEAVNGRGGDGGIDIRLRQRETGAQTILQLKFFVDGFSGKRRDRQRQIRDSLTAALSHSPEGWILIIPSVPTRADYAFIEGLRAENDVPIELWHRTRLDKLLAKHPSVINVMRRDPALLEYAVTSNMEQAVLANGTRDLSDRVSKLGEVVDSLDPDWTFDFARRGATTYNILRAKHPNAATVSPIRFHFNTAFNDRNRDIERQLERTLGWGLAGNVTLPPETVRDFRIDGPPLVQRDGANNFELTFEVPVNQQIVGKPVAMQLNARGGQRVGTHRGEAVHGSPGSVGNSLQARFHQSVALTFLIPHQDSGPCTLEVAYDANAAARSPSALRRATQLLLDLGAAAEMRISIDDLPLLTGRATESFNLPDSANWMEQVRQLHELADDISAIERAIGEDLPVPTSLTTTERIYVRCARLMLDGQCVMSPNLTSFDLTLRAGLTGNEPGISELVDGPGGAIAITADPWTLTLDEREVTLPATQMWHPQMRLEHQASVKTSLQKGLETDARLTPIDGTTFRMYMTDRLTDPDRPLVPAPWNLSGVDQDLPT